MPLDLDHLLKLRLAVARFGEADGAHWWNTKVLGRHGAILYERGFPKTHPFARARAAFTVARVRCDEVFDPPGCITLWKLPPETEDAFESQWQVWLDQPAAWAPFFERILQPGTDLLATLTELGLLGNARERLATVRRSADGRGVPLPGVPALDDMTVTLLAAGFCRGGVRDLVVPYARVDG